MVKFVFSFFGHVPKQDFAPEKAELFWAKNILLQLRGDDLVKIKSKQVFTWLWIVVNRIMNRRARLDSLIT